MFVRIISFLVGFGLTVIGFTYIILFLNYLSIGYNFVDYVYFIIRQFECYYSLFGIIIMYLSFNISGGKNSELYL